jgi:hypothetical protein
MKPKPFSALKNFTVPVAIACSFNEIEPHSDGWSMTLPCPSRSSQHSAPTTLTHLLNFAPLPPIHQYDEANQVRRDDEQQ